MNTAQLVVAWPRLRRRAAPAQPPRPRLPAPWLSHPGRLLPALLHAVTQHLGAVALVASAISAVVASEVVARRRRRRRHRAVLTRGARCIEVQLPPEADQGGAAALWTNLHDLLRPRWRRWWDGQPHLVFEVVADAGGTTIGLWVPGPVPPGLVERAVEAAWPGARAIPRPVPAVMPPDSATLGGELRLARPEWFPLKSDHDADPYRALLGAMAELADGETVVVQVLARPLTGRRPARARRAAAQLRHGGTSNIAARCVDAVLPGPPLQPPRRDVDPGTSAEIRAVLTKAAAPAWEVVLRYGVARPEPADGGALRGRAHAVASAFALYTDHNRLARRELRSPAPALAGRQLRRGDMVSVAELAALAHLPLDITAAGLARAGARAVAPPPAVGSVGKVLGDAAVGTRRPVALAVADACFHLHVLGATGSGKSTLLANLILGDIGAGRGVVVIDPKGDLVTDVLDRMPSAAMGRVVLIDPDEADAPPALNVLEGADPDLAVDHLVGIFRSIFAAFWGPRTDDILRSACLTLLRRPGATLADVPRLLAEQRFRAPYLADLVDPVGLGGFWSWYEAMSDAERARVIGPVMNKLRAFLLRGFVRAVVGSVSSSFDMTQVLDGGVCLVRVPKGLLGDDTARLLGSFVVARVWQAAAARARTGLGLRSPAALYVDECQNFLTLPRSFEEMLAEARAYGLSLVLAHQHLGQLPRELRDALSANARSKVFFSTSPEDAHILERHVSPELGAHDLSHLEAYQAACRVVVAGAETAAFTVRTRPLPPSTGSAAAVRASARQVFGRTDEQRNAEVMARRAGRIASHGLAPAGGTWVGSFHLPTSITAEPQHSGAVPPAAMEADSQTDVGQ